jgi:hypothetical protein
MNKHALLRDLEYLKSALNENNDNENNDVKDITRKKIITK